MDKSTILVVGKVLIDEFNEKGRLRRSVGGGGPQAAFGSSVVLPEGKPLLISLAGSDLGSSTELVDILRRTGANLSGVKILDLITPHFRITINDDVPEHEEGPGFENWLTMLQTDYEIPSGHESIDTMHVLIERGGFNDLRLARAWRKNASPGSFLSFEPVILRESPQEDYNSFRAIVSECDTVSPDCNCFYLSVVKDSDPREVINEWSTYGPSSVTVRCGREGSYLWDRKEGKSWHIPIFEVSTIDVTGAGNAYAAAYATARYVLGHAPLYSASLASAAGAAAVLSEGLPPVDDALKKFVYDAAEDIISRVVQL
ncbi:hypothetical protein NDN08_002672 [Rhodosorus marinus]|uniref:Carbohydrate kinase PfkB domain-containing protein n=1 Tax=Rhodosorus marinus TaxID=101924 RepID=A0AAV8UYS7_9RHOD|nr:hypothetical protein NDN08_002672 [Rhodosorus marinus]